MEKKRDRCCTNRREFIAQAGLYTAAVAAAAGAPDAQGEASKPAELLPTTLGYVYIWHCLVSF
jgi:hypothetical protein